MKRFMTRISNSDGSILVFTVVIAFIFMLLSMTALKSLSTAKTNASNYAQNIQSFYIAEAGLEKAKKSLEVLSPTEFYQALEKQKKNTTVSYQSAEMYNGAYAVKFTGDYDPTFIQNSNGMIIVNKKVDITIKIVEKMFLCYKLPSLSESVNYDLTLQYSLDEGAHWLNFNYGLPLTSGITDTVKGVNQGAKVILKIHPVSNKKCSDVDRASDIDPDYILMFRYGDKLNTDLINLVGANDQSSLKKVLQKYLNATDNTIANIQLSDVLYLCEIGNKTYKSIKTAANPTLIDYQDVIVLVSSDPTPYQTQNFSLTSTATLHDTKTVLQATGIKSFTNNSLKITSWKD